MEKRQLRIEILGSSFDIQSDDSTEQLARLSSFVKSKVEEVKGRYTFADPLTIAVLAALNIADELFKAREGREPPIQGEDIGILADRLINSIDDKLLEHTPYTDEPTRS